MRPCYTLTLGHSGAGADPSVDLPNSPACGNDTYHAGEVLSLHAQPAEGLAIGAWSGTDNDAMLTPGNTVTMPAANHDVSVSYVEIPAGCHLLHSGHTGLGSDDDRSFLWVNSLDMPVNHHTVTVRYVTPALVRDIRPGAYGAFNRSDWSVVSYTQPAALGSTLFFAANDGVHGMELWKSDGTPGGTSLVKDIWPGSDSAFPWSTAATFFSQTFVAMDDHVYFVADDRGNNYELWKSDGTAVGTVMVKDTHEIWNGLPSNLTNVGGTLFFSLRYGFEPTIIELWKSDGTEGGTTMVKDMTADAGGNAPDRITALGGLAIFRAGGAPWISDGTEEGTVRLKDITVTPDTNSNFMRINDEVFFGADDGIYGHELWKTDGTIEGTILVKNIAVNQESRPNRLTAVDDTLYFHATDYGGPGENHGHELWKSDGTGTGTTLVRDIRPGYLDGFPMELTEMAGRLVFIANDNPLGGAAANYEPWISDSTEGGTERIAETYPGLNPINWIPRNFEEIGDTVFFAAFNQFNGKELWQTDGTATGTTMVRDIWAGSSSSYPDWLIDADGVLFFRADDGPHGSEIWVLRDDSRCHSLTLNHSGQGGDPFPDPPNSMDCDPGYFEESEVVTLTASPDPDWTVGSWSGSDNDGSTSAINSVTMPAVNHSVTVNYSAPDLFFADGFEQGDN